MSNLRVFVDTAFVQALFNRADTYHQRARQWSLHLRGGGEIWTTEAILVEIGNALSTSNRRAAVEFVKQVYRTPGAHVIPVDTALIQRAISLYEGRSDKTWGLTDCISFVVMSEHGIHEALTADHHFEQAGFAALLLRDPPD